MSIPHGLLPRARHRGIVSQTISGETLFYVEDTHQASCLNSSAALILSLCDGNRTVAAIAVEARLDVEVVAHALAHLAESGLLENPPQRALATNLSRRRMLAGVALVAIPTILLVTAPDARASASTCTAPNSSCSPLTPETCCSGECNLGICG